MDKIIVEMESPDREIARSFMSWANAGSHSAFDDETFMNTNEVTDSYKKVLRLIFEKANYGSHYDEMVGKYSTSEGVFYGMFLKCLKGDSTTNNLTMLRLKPEDDICITIFASQSLTDNASDLSLVVKDILEVMKGSLLKIRPLKSWLV